MPRLYLGLFGSLGAVYFGLCMVLFTLRIVSYFGDVLRTFEFARRWFE